MAIADKHEVLDAMYETVESSNATITSVKDLISNVRTDVKAIPPLAITVDLIRLKLSEMTKGVDGLEGKTKFSYVCLACGKPLLPKLKDLSVLE